MKQRFFLFSALILFCPTLSIYAQDLDFMQFSRYGNPPDVANYLVTNPTGEVSVEKILFKPDVAYAGQTVLEVETFVGEETADTKQSSLFVKFNDTNLVLYGTTFVDSTLGAVELQTREPMSFMRFVSPGFTEMKTGQSSISLGPIPVTVDVNITFNYIGLETLVLDSGTFTDALKVESTRTIALTGVDLVGQHRIEWYHPTAGLIQYQDVDSGNISRLQSTNPPFEIDTDVSEWALH